MMHDHRGAPVTGANERSLELFETALAELNCYRGDPVAGAERVAAESPAFAMAHALKAYILLMGAEKDLVPEAVAAANRMRNLQLNDRERAHAGAIYALACGEFHEASRRLDQILVDDPRDILALQIGHTCDVCRGDVRNLRDRVARVLPEWHGGLPGYHAVLGMQAFGLEECGDYARAEAFGRRSVELNPKDGWAHHAVAHVMEMQGRTEEGIAWLGSGSASWRQDSFLAVHNWWHLALFHLEIDDVAGALDLYDEAVRGRHSSLVIDMIDASSLLWRLAIRGTDVGDRWQELADAWMPRVQDGYYAFNDIHALMAFLGSERLDDAYRLLAVMEGAKLVPSPNGGMTREVGLPLAHALLDYHHGRYDRCATALLSVRPIAHRFGGSHAQRDVIDLTLIEAAERSGNHALVRALANERLQRKPESPLAHRYRSRSLMAMAA